jgi:hypothetical protein
MQPGVASPGRVPTYAGTLAETICPEQPRPRHRFRRNDPDMSVLVKRAVQTMRRFEYGYHRSLEIRDNRFTADDS